MILSFAKLGEYRMHTHPLKGDSLGVAKPFHCTIHNRDELLTEIIEIHRGETLHGQDDQGIEWPLAKFDQHAFWVWMPKQDLWWPLRQGSVQLNLDRWNRVRIKWLNLPNAIA